ncbi:type VI secretion system protein TssA [Rhodospirillaceae bacterium]|jgi:type VI secretion system protein ImpA|nr:type VI secretion system protein TssA [Rhodospirillaceae bacterium]MBT6304858.1 type VI secretion system protein TssA [Rhodospirillaceae bacterium]MDC1441528.1 type VI secretion system protein TssA [Rhodospirillaceae bacterium]
MHDLTVLLDPINPDQPGGMSLLYEGIHQEIMEARREDDPNLPRGDWSRPLKVSDWQSVISLATTTLLEKSKDLRVAVMLSEALVYQNGLGGFTAATNFLIKFIDLYWDDMHPLVDEAADLESRMLILEWFSEKSGLAIKFQHITAPIAGHLAYNLIDWLEVEKLIKAGPVKLTRRQRLGSQQPEHIRGPTIQSFEDSITATPTAWLRSNTEAIKEALHAIDQLDELIVQKMPDNVPNFRPIKEAMNQMYSKSTELNQIRERTERELVINNQTIETDTNLDDEAKLGLGLNDHAPTLVSTNNGSKGSKPLKTGFASRKEAYDSLEEISKYLMATDPHSPTPYLLRKAVSFRNMTFADLLTTLVDDEWHRSNLLKLMGVGNSDQNSDKEK